MAPRETVPRVGWWAPAVVSRSCHMPPDRAAVGVGGGRRGEAVVAALAGERNVGGEESIATERAGGARADEPGIDAGVVEEVVAPQLAHLLAVADHGEAEGAVRVRLCRLLLLALRLPAAVA